MRWAAILACGTRGVQLGMMRRSRSLGAQRTGNNGRVANLEEAHEYRRSAGDDDGAAPSSSIWRDMAIGTSCAQFRASCRPQAARRAVPVRCARLSAAGSNGAAALGEVWPKTARRWSGRDEACLRHVDAHGRFCACSRSREVKRATCGAEHERHGGRRASKSRCAVNWKPGRVSARGVGAQGAGSIPAAPSRLFHPAARLMTRDAELVLGVPICSAVAALLM